MFLADLWALHDEFHVALTATETFAARMAVGRDYRARLAALSRALPAQPDRAMAGEHYGIVCASVDSSFRAFVPEDWPATERAQWNAWHASKRGI